MLALPGIHIEITSLRVILSFSDPNQVPAPDLIQFHDFSHFLCDRIGKDLPAENRISAVIIVHRIFPFRETEANIRLPQHGKVRFAVACSQSKESRMSSAVTRQGLSFIQRSRKHIDLPRITENLKMLRIGLLLQVSADFLRLIRL